MALEFDAQLRRLSDMVILDLHGDINALAESTLNRVYAEAEALRPPAILLNFGEVSYINSTGIALIVGLLARARAAGRTLLACGLTDHYMEIFTITRLADFMMLFPDEVSAVNSRTAPEGAV
jgi:anti-anti-sigma factor